MIVGIAARIQSRVKIDSVICMKSPWCFALTARSSRLGSYWYTNFRTRLAHTITTVVTLYAGATASEKKVPE